MIDFFLYYFDQFSIFFLILATFAAGLFAIYFFAKGAIPIINDYYKNKKELHNERIRFLQREKQYKEEKEKKRQAVMQEEQKIAENEKKGQYEEKAREEESKLIKCPDCSKEVSKRASVCPNCGCPIAGGNNSQTSWEKTQISGKKVQTIEKTSKNLKGQQLLSALIMIIGFFSCIVVHPGGSFLLLIGGVWYLVVSISIWWHHG